MVIKQQIAKILKHMVPDLPDPRTMPQTKIALRQLFHYYADRAHSGIPLNIPDTGARIFSQFEEDGILLAIFATIGTHRKNFVDIGAGDGINSNCANLALNFGWDGLFIDGNLANISKGREFYNKHPDTWCYPPRFIQGIVTRETINDLILNAGFSGEIDFLSIDIDGNDYWIWDALTCIEPRVVIIETVIEFGLNSIVVPYDAAYYYPPKKNPHYFGASPVAMNKLAEKKGYRLVGCMNYGFNTIYIRKDICKDLIPGIPVEQVLNHPRNAERMKLFDEIKNWEYTQV